MWKFEDVMAKLQPGLNFTAAKFVIIRDWRLGLILRAFQLAIAIYILTVIIRDAAYQITEVPTGIISPLANFKKIPREDLFTTVATSVNNNTVAEDFPYCINSDTGQGDYDFQWQGQRFENIRCVVVDLPSLTAKGETQFFFATFFTLNKLFFLKTNNRGGCPEEDNFARNDIPEGSKLLVNTSDFGIENSTCIYENIQQFFPMLSESSNLALTHSYQTSIVDEDGSLPRTIITRHNNYTTDVEFQENERVELSVEKWLELAGVDLDAELLQSDIPGDAFEELRGDNNTDFYERVPRQRLSGIEIVLTFNYYQRRVAPSEWKKAVGSGSTDIFCHIEVEPRYRWTVQGSDVRYMINSPLDPVFLEPGGGSLDNTTSNVVSTTVDFQRQGILFTFQVGGELGKFDVNSLIAALVSGSVLLTIAQTVVTFVALYALGLSSILYQEFMREQVVWRKEYARFAAQALVAGYAFMMYDTDTSWKLNRTEIYRTLKTLLGQRLTEEKIAALADFMMRHGETDEKVDQGTFSLEENDIPANNEISIEEWINIFTEDKVHVKALERLIDSEYKDARTREFLVRLAQGGKARELLQEYREGELQPIKADEEVAPDIEEYQRANKQQLMEGFLKDVAHSPRSDGVDIESGKDDDKK